MTRADHTGDVQRLFDAKAPRWSRKYDDGTLSPRIELFTNVLSSGTADGSRVVDLGCGAGDLARALAGRGYHVTGCDISPRMLAMARALSPGGEIDWIDLPTHWSVLPFPAGSVDAVVASSVFEYVPNLSDVLSECRRILRGGGRLMCTVPNVKHRIRRLESVLRRFVPIVAAHPRAAPSRRLRQYFDYLRVSVNRMPIPQWREEAVRAGFQLVSARDGAASLVLLEFVAAELPDRPSDA
jgi:SAM-dependent methyltransferase